MSEFHEQAIKDVEIEYQSALDLTAFDARHIYRQIARTQRESVLALQAEVERLRKRLKDCLVFDIPKDIDSLMWDSRPSSFNLMPDATHNRQILEAYSVGLDASQATIAKLRELLNIAAPYMRAVVAAEEMEAIDAALTERP